MKPREFFKRWGEGIQQITPFQQSKINLMGSSLVLIGVVIGIFTTLTLKIWWLFIILLGSFLLTSMGMLGNIQKYKALKRINKQMEENMESEEPEKEEPKEEPKEESTD